MILGPSLKLAVSRKTGESEGEPAGGEAGGHPMIGYLDDESSSSLANASRQQHGASMRFAVEVVAS